MTMTRTVGLLSRTRPALEPIAGRVVRDVTGWGLTTSDRDQPSPRPPRTRYTARNAETPMEKPAA